MKKIAEIALGEPVTKAVVTVPADFGSTQRALTKEACKRAGMDPLRIINEPTAAALAYGFQNKIAKEMNILVFDFGGGTLDTTIL